MNFSAKELWLTEGGLAFAYLLAVAAIAVGLIPITPFRLMVAKGCFWGPCAIFAGVALAWGCMTDSSLLARIIIIGFLCAVAGIAAVETSRFLAHANQLPEAPLHSAPKPHDVSPPTGVGGKGGSGQIFGNNGKIVGGAGGRVGAGGTGRGGDGGGGVIHGDNGIIIGGEGGSVDGPDIWFPPAQSAYIQDLESLGQTPDFDVQYPGAGGASSGWLQRQQVIVKIREEYFKKHGQKAKIASSKIDDVPLTHINKELERAGYPWRARIDKKYWYLYYTPESRQ